MGRGDPRLRTPAPPAVRTLREACVRTQNAEGRWVWAGRRTTVSRRLRPWGRGGAVGRLSCSALVAVPAVGCAGLWGQDLREQAQARKQPRWPMSCGQQT